MISKRILAYSTHAKSRGDHRRRVARPGSGEGRADLGLETHVVEFAPRLMPRQIDDNGSERSWKKLKRWTFVCILVKHQSISRQRQSRGAGFHRRSSARRRHGCDLSGDSASRRIGRDCGIEVGARGGVVVDDCLRTSDPATFAIGEVALHRGMIYGLVAPDTRWLTSSRRTSLARVARSPDSTCQQH